MTNDSGGGDYVDVYLVDSTGLILSRDGVWIPNLVTTYNFTMNGTTTVNPVASPFRLVIYDNISLATRLAVGTNISAAIYSLLDDITFNPYSTDPDCPFYDSVAPVLTAFGRNTPTTQVTNADTLIFDITFNESVTGADVSDFAITGTTATASGALGGSGNSYRLTITGGDLASFNGTVGLNLNSGHGITDTAGNALPTTEPATDLTFTLENTAPRIASIVRQTPSSSPTNADSLTWRVTFDEAVLNVTTGDFSATGTTATITSVTNPSGNSFDVTVSGGDLADLDATVTLGFSGGQDIADSAGNALGNTSPTGTNDNTFVVDNTPPSGYSFAIDQDPINSGNAGAVSVTFAGLEVGTTYTYSLSSSGGGTPLPGFGTALIASGTLPGADASGLADGTITASITLTDAAGNTGAAATDTATKDTVAPSVVSIARHAPVSDTTNADSLTWRVTFDEAVVNITGGGAFNPSVSDFTVTGTTAAVTGLSVQLGNAYDVTVSGGNLAELSGTVTLGFAGGQSLSDLAGNALANLTPTTTNEPGYSVNNQTPTIASITRQTPLAERTNADTLVWDISFSQISPLLSLNPGDFNLIGTTATLSLERYSTGFIATATGGDLAALNGVVSLFLGDGPNSDEFGNVVNPMPTGVTETYTVDNTAPSGYSFTIDQDPINSGNAGAVSVTFAGLEVGTTYSYSLSSSGGGTPITGSGAALIAGGTLPGADATGLADGTITASITLTDAAGNTGAAATDTATKDATAPAGYSVAILPTAIHADIIDSIGMTFTGVEAGSTMAFSLVSSGGGTSISVSGAAAASGTSFTATQIEAMNDGTLAASLTVTDAVGNVGATVTNSGVKDVIAPRIASIERLAPSAYRTNADSVTWRVTFDEGITLNGNAVDAFTVAGAFTVASVPGTTLVASVVSPTQIDVELSGAAVVDANRSFTLFVPTNTGIIADVAGNLLANLEPAGDWDGFVIDNTPPSATASASASGLVTLNGFNFDMDFNEVMVGVEASDLIVTNGVAESVFLSSVVGNTNTYRAVIRPVAEGAVTVRLPANAATDEAGNGNLSSNTVEVTADGTAPTVLAIDFTTPGGSPTASDTLEWTVTVSEPLSGITPSDFDLSGTTATVTSITNPDDPADPGNPIQNVYILTASGGDLADLNAGVVLSRQGIVRDIAGNFLSGFTPAGLDQRQVTVDNAAPRIASITRQSPATSLTNADSLTWIVTFDEIVSAVDAADFVLTGSTASLSVAPVVSGDQP